MVRKDPPQTGSSIASKILKGLPSKAFRAPKSSPAVSPSYCEASRKHNFLIQTSIFSHSQFLPPPSQLRWIPSKFLDGILRPAHFSAEFAVPKIFGNSIELFPSQVVLNGIPKLYRNLVASHSLCSTSLGARFCLQECWSWRPTDVLVIRGSMAEINDCIQRPPLALPSFLELRVTRVRSCLWRSSYNLNIGIVLTLPTFK